MLSQAGLDQQFWTFAFYTASYLINRLITPTLENKSPFEILFQKPPNYKSLKTFGCLCYPWLKPYTSHKLQSPSKPCVYLGPLRSQSGFLCFDPIHNKVYHSRHVEFIEHIFPYKVLSSPTSNPMDPQVLSHPIIDSTHTYLPFPHLSPPRTSSSSSPPQKSPSLSLQQLSTNPILPTSQSSSTPHVSPTLTPLSRMSPSNKSLSPLPIMSDTSHSNADSTTRPLASTKSICESISSIPTLLPNTSPTHAMRTHAMRT